jgi:hypothetical protein
VQREAVVREFATALDQGRTGYAGKIEKANPDLKVDLASIERAYQVARTHR